MATGAHRSSPNKKVQSSRTSRPAPVPRRSYTSGVRAGSSTSPKERPRSILKKEEDEEDFMAASFLQFCAACEKQIIVPSNSLLYCSESCRRKDNATRAHLYHDGADISPPQTPFLSMSFEDLPVRDIVPQRSPTTTSNHRSAMAESRSSLNVRPEVAYSSDDGSGSSSGEETRRKLDRSDSEAAKYLRQFQSPGPQSGRATRPRGSRSATSAALPTGTSTVPPSLSNTPSSSFSMSIPYTPNSRHLPPRTNPHSTSYGAAAKSIELVTPFSPYISTSSATNRHSIYTTTTAPSSLATYNPTSLKSGLAAARSIPLSHTEISSSTDEAFAKMTLAAEAGSAATAKGSLKEMFRFAEMQKPPTPQTMGTRGSWLA